MGACWEGPGDRFEDVVRGQAEGCPGQVGGTEPLPSGINDLFLNFLITREKHVLSKSQMDLLTLKR